VLQFNTGFYSVTEGRWVTERPKIAADYLSFWFWLDLASLLPFKAMVPSNKAGSVSILRLVRLVRLFKLMRVCKAPRILAHLDVFAMMSAGRRPRALGRVFLGARRGGPSLSVWRRFLGARPGESVAFR